MTRARRIEWTRERLERLMELSGTVEHVGFAIELGAKVNTIYAMRVKVREHGGVDAFLARHVRKPGPQGPHAHRHERDVYVISHQDSAGRGTATQYKLTIPASLATRFIERFGLRVRFEEQADGSLLIVTAGSGKTEPGSAGTEPPATTGSA